MRDVKTSKPPETSAVQAPFARIVATSSRPPDASVSAARYDVVDHCRIQPLQQRDALAQRRLEGDFAVHRTGGNGCDVLLDADLVGKLVDAFLVDHGRIHVGDQNFLGASLALLHNDIDRLRRDRLAQGSEGFRGVEAGGQSKVAGDIVGQPVGRGRSHSLRSQRRQWLRDRAPGRMGYERGDERHGKIR